MCQNSEGLVELKEVEMGKYSSYNIFAYTIILEGCAINSEN